jgi:chromosome segregation ATPase
MTTELFIQLLAVAMGAGGVGTILLRLVEGFLKRGERQGDEASVIRKELYERNKVLSDRLDESNKKADMQEEKYIARFDQIQLELDSWKKRFYDLQANYFDLMGQKEMLEQKCVTMQCEITALRQEVNKLQSAKKKS